MSSIICKKCSISKKLYDYVVPDLTENISQICRKCHHSIQNINDYRYENFIIMHKKTQNIINGLHIVRENIINDEKTVNDDNYLETFDNIIEENYRLLKDLENNLKDIELWTSLIKHML